jgi:hypothetical protein
VKVEAPEFLPARDILERFPPCPAFDELLERPSSFIVKPVLNVRQEPGTVPAEHVAKKQLGIEPGVRYTRRSQFGRCAVYCFNESHV